MAWMQNKALWRGMEEPRAVVSVVSVWWGGGTRDFYQQYQIARYVHCAWFRLAEAHCSSYQDSVKHELAKVPTICHMKHNDNHNH